MCRTYADEKKKLLLFPPLRMARVAPARRAARAAMFALNLFMLDPCTMMPQPDDMAAAEVKDKDSLGWLLQRANETAGMVCERVHDSRRTSCDGSALAGHRIAHQCQSPSCARHNKRPR